MWTEPYFKLAVMLGIVFLITINVIHQRDLVASIRAVGIQCKTYTMTIP